MFDIKKRVEFSFVCHLDILELTPPASSCRPFGLFKSGKFSLMHEMDTNQHRLTVAPDSEALKLCKCVVAYMFA